jgi:hypothetical protein
MTEQTKMTQEKKKSKVGNIIREDGRTFICLKELKSGLKVREVFLRKGGMKMGEFYTIK